MFVIVGIVVVVVIIITKIKTIKMAGRRGPGRQGTILMQAVSPEAYDTSVARIIRIIIIIIIIIM